MKRIITLVIMAALLSGSTLAEGRGGSLDRKKLQAIRNMKSTAPNTSGEAFVALATDLGMNYGILIGHPRDLIGKSNDIKAAVRSKLDAKKQAALDLVDSGAGLKQVVEAQQEVIEELATAVELLLHAQSFQIRVAADQ